jgi:hypothetical protein
VLALRAGPAAGSGGGGGGAGRLGRSRAGAGGSDDRDRHGHCVSNLRLGVTACRTLRRPGRRRSLAGWPPDAGAAAGASLVCCLTVQHSGLRPTTSIMPVISVQAFKVGAEPAQLVTSQCSPERYGTVRRSQRLGT